MHELNIQHFRSFIQQFVEELLWNETEGSQARTVSLLQLHDRAICLSQRFFKLTQVTLSVISTSLGRLSMKFYDIDGPEPPCPSTLDFKK